MRTNQLLLVAVSIFSFSHSLHAQQDCSQSLIQAERAYYTGRFAEIGPILASCLADGFDKKQKVEGLKLMALAFMFSRDYEQADSCLYKMLRLNPQFEPGPEDPPELQARLEKFDARPLFGLTINGGAYVPFLNITQVYSLRNVPNYVTYESSIGYQVGLAADYYINKSIVFEGSYEIQSMHFKMTNSNEFATTVMEEKQFQQQFSASGGYTHKWGGVFGQLLVGVAFSSLLQANSSIYKLETTDRSGGGQLVYSDGSFSNMERRRRNITKPFVLARISLSQNNGFLFSIYARYEYGLGGLTKDRYSDASQIVQFDWVEDDFKANFFALGLGITKLHYNVRK